MNHKINDKIAFLSLAGKILSSSLDYNVSLVSIAKLVIESVADFCMIDLFDENTGELKRVTVKMYDGKKEKLAQKFYDFPPDSSNKAAIYEAARLKHPIVIKNVNEKWLRNVTKFSEEKELVMSLGFTSLIFVPLMSRDRVIGVMTIASIEEGFSYGEEDSIFVKELADRAGITVDKARLFTQAQEAIAERDEFLAIASHELKTPLTSILLSLQLVLNKIKKSADKTDSDKQMIHALEVAILKSKRMSFLIKDLLNVSLASGDFYPLYKERVNLNELIHDVFMNLEIILIKDNIKLTIEERDKKIIGYWDKVRIEQAISNLITNAMKYGEKKPIKIIVDRKNNNAFISVIDQGVGISKDDKKLIFRVFKRAERTKNSYSGIGVGLFIASKIIEAHGGNISLKSRPGRGANFIIKLPIK